MTPRRALSYQLLLLITLIFSGCAQTYLTGAPLGDEYLRLASASSRKVVVSMQLPPQQISLGRQWVFGILPLGRVVCPDQAQFLSVALFQRLALRGYASTIVPQSEINLLARQGSDGAIVAPHFRITDAEIRCSVPDLFFVRIVRCSISVEGTRADAPTITLTGSGVSSAYRTVGFKPQLESALAQATAQALDGLLDQMHL
ncbi:MAG: hypothetical protein EBZ48_05955 [Proteobacteria bacterium]|nr:hypothetical protein [Pseudomonadota bacterium]